MNKPRMNLYAFPHKGLRNAISQLSLIAGNTNCSDQDSINTLKSLAEEVFTLLELHAHSEETVVLSALEAKVPGSSDENIAEHAQLEKEIEAMKQELIPITSDSPPSLVSNFYGAVSNFYSNYLAHMAMEESKMNTIIWENFTDDELMEQHGKIMSSLTPEQIMMWFKYIIPALNHFERTIIMGGFKANAPTPFFNMVLDMLSGLIKQKEHQQLSTALS
ncbi:MAG: hemerythrin domain-containing protein [Gammaproteobacteria bacterium]|nr:hemerythrin domain-containing protein [Gammaproteobacteria bacterium]